MARPDTRTHIPPNRFGALFAKARTTAYIDNASSNPRPSSTANTATASSTSASSSSSSARITTLAWSPLGTLIATGALNHKLRVWNPERVHVRHSTELRGHTSSIERVAFHPAREAELASGALDGSVKVWDVRSKREVGGLKLPGIEIFSMAWTPDGEELLVGGRDDTFVRISRREMREIDRRPETRGTNHVAFSHAGEHVFLTRADGDVTIAAYPSLTPLHSLHAHTAQSYVASLSPTGGVLGVGGKDALVTLWDTREWFCIRALTTASAGSVGSLSFSWDGGYIAAGGEDNRGVEVVHVDTGETVHRVEAPGQVGTVCWSPKDYSLAYSVDQGGGAVGGLRIVNGSHMV